jgi:hypothetical protein
MSARLKSSVLRREEKGIGSISMGRLILAGMFAGVCFFGMRLLGLNFLIIPAALAGFVGCLMVTHPRQGIPLYLYWSIILRSRLMLASENEQEGWMGQLGRFMEMRVEALTLDSTKLLSAPINPTEVGSLDEWEIVPDSVQMVGFEVVTESGHLEIQQDVQSR